MINLRRSVFLFAATIMLIALVSCMAIPKEPLTGNPEFLNSIYFNGTSGKVGHHMVASAFATCGESWSDSGVKMIRGSLPPGLTRNGSTIQGTPTQPGNWSVTIRFIKPTCRGKTYPDKDIRVNFHIEGIAPKRLK